MIWNAFKCLNRIIKTYLDLINFKNRKSIPAIDNNKIELINIKFTLSDVSGVLVLFFINVFRLVVLSALIHYFSPAHPFCVIRYGHVYQVVVGYWLFSSYFINCVIIKYFYISEPYGYLNDKIFVKYRNTIGI